MMRNFVTITRYYNGDQMHVARMKEKRNSHADLVRGREGKRPRGRSMFGLEEVIKMDIKQIGSEG
jgi:hypothetical protein